MPLVKDEQSVKQDTLFPKYNVGSEGNELILKSHLYRIDTHFIPEPFKKSVICMGDSCVVCKRGKNPKRSEYNYFVRLNGEDGFMDVKGSVFFNIKGISKAQKKDPRQISWTVIKTGEGLSTEYTTSKNDNIPQEDYDALQRVIESNTEKLEEMMLKREEKLEAAYNELIARFPKEEEEIEESLVVEDKASEQDVDPEEVPF